MKRSTLIGFFLIIFCSFHSYSQNYRYYLTATSTDFQPKLSESMGLVVYKGSDRGLKKVFESNNIYIFKKAFNHSRQSILKRTWYVESDSADLHNKFLEYAGHIFNFGEYIGNEPIFLTQNDGESLFLTSNNKIDEFQKTIIPGTIKEDDFSNIFFPNDYGTTSPIGNLGINVALDNFDFIGVPQAWEYTTGSKEIIIGLSDARLLVNWDGLEDDDPEFVDKTTLFYDSGFPSISNGHGYSVAMLMAGQGNNGIGSTGICYDCDIYPTLYGPGNYDALLEISNAGARVINCSWRTSTFSTIHQMCVNEIYENGTIIVAAAGNSNTLPLQYPASYEHVISVGGIGHKKELLIEYAVPDASYFTIRNVKNYIGAKVWVDINETDPVEFINSTVINPTSASTRNEAIDINAPGAGLFNYGKYLINMFNGINDVNQSLIGEQRFSTSSSTPQVSGAIGLMLDLNQCLSFEEVESILKITSTYIGEIPAHNYGNWINRYGAGGLHVGRSVKLVNDLLDPNETAYLENQKFTRWDFNFKGVSEKIEIRNQEFTESSALNVTAKNRILIEENSLIEPNNEGNAILEIDPSLTIDTLCDIAGFTDIQNDQQEVRQTNESLAFRVYPTRVESIVTVEKVVGNSSDLSKIVVYDLFNRMVYSNTQLDGLRNGNKINLNLSELKGGIYLLKGYFVDSEETLTVKLIKD